MELVMVILALGLVYGQQQRAADNYGSYMCNKSRQPNFAYHHSNDTIGPAFWRRASICCNGPRQSPIDIKTSKSECRSMQPVAYSGPTRVVGPVENTGNGVKVTIEAPTVVSYTFPFSSDAYLLHSMHYHVPSEHYIDGVQYEGEIHLVHFNQRYHTLGAAVDKPDGLAVIGILLELSNSSYNRPLESFIQAVEDISANESANVWMENVNVRKFLSKDESDFYTYAGSLTTPPCSESVRWVVMKKTMPITQSQVDILNDVPVDDGEVISNHTNARPLQKIRGRTVYQRC